MGDGVIQSSFKDKYPVPYFFVLKDDKLPTVTRQLPTSDSGAWTGVRIKETTNADDKPITRTVRFKTPVRYHGEFVHVVEMEDIDRKGERDYYNR